MANAGLQQIFEESVSAVTATPSIQLGTERWKNGIKYQYVYNKSSSTASVGYAVVRIGANGSASSGYSVTVSSVSRTGDLAGVVVHTDIAAGSYGWVAVKGAVTANTDSGATAGYAVIMGTDGKFISASGVTNPVHVAVALTAQTVSTTTNTFTAFVNCS